MSKGINKQKLTNVLREFFFYISFESCLDFTLKNVFSVMITFSCFFILITLTVKIIITLIIKDKERLSLIS